MALSMSTAKAIISALLLSFCGAILTACESTTLTRGNMPSAYQIDQLQIGKDSRQQVIAKLGTPSVQSAADPNYWFYTGQTLKDHPLFGRELIRQSVLVVEFGDFDRLTNLSQFETGVDGVITPLSETTTISMRDRGMIEQVLDTLFPGASFN